MLFRMLRERRARNQYIVDALAYLVHRTPIIMSALEDLKAATSRLESGVASAEQKLDDNGATIKELTGKLAAAATAPTAMSESDAKDIVDRLNKLADGLSGHIAPVADAAGAISSVASGEAPPASSAAAPQA